MELIDIGANLASKQFKSDLDGVIERGREAGVARMIVTGTSQSVSEEAEALASQHDGLWSTAGVHPHDASGFTAATREALAKLSSRPTVVAIGECGLDFNRNYSPRDAQIAAFDAQLQLAAETDLPLFLHQRDAHKEFLAMLKNAWPSLSAGAIVHCFTDGPDEAADYLELGCSLGVTGWVCDERRGDALRAAVKTIPADKLLLETDAPYLLPRTIQPKPTTRRNEPMHLPWVVREVASLRGEAPELVAENAWRATCSAFNLPPQ